MRANKKRYPLNVTDDIRDLKQLADRSVRLYPDHVAFAAMKDRTNSESITYAQFGRELCALGNALIDAGWSGKRIALVGENSYFWVLSYLATVTCGAIIVPLDKELPGEQMAELISRAGASVFIHSHDYQVEAALAAEVNQDLVTVCMKDGGASEMTLPGLIARGQEILQSGDDRYSGIEIKEDTLSTILFTSGTTGKSKGVMLSHYNIVSNVLSAAQLVLFTDTDVLLSVLPINHSFEATCGILGPLYCGSCIAFCGELKKLPNCLKLFRPTVMALVPLYVETFVSRIWDSAKKQGKETKLKAGVAIGNILGAVGIDVKEKLLAEVRAFFGGRLKLAVCGGAYLNPELVGAFKDFGITLVQGYGITECAPMVSTNRNRSIKADSVGWIAPCNEVSFDKDGQLLVRGDNVMIGYLDDPEGTKEAFDGEWFKTGDLAFLGRDGFLYLNGRCKNLIVLKNGKNIMPDEIEYMLKKSQYVAEAMVKETGSDAGGATGIMAIIYPDPATTSGMQSHLVSAAIQKDIDAMNARLAAYKRVQHFVLRSSAFPKTSTRKIQRYKVGE